MGHQHIPINLRILVVSKWQEGNQSFGQIGKDLNMSKSSVASIVRRFKENGSVENAEKSGRPRKTNDRIDRKIVREASKDPLVTSK